MINKQSTLGFDKIYVINLKRRPDRKENLIKTLPGLDLTFIEAVDGNELSVEQLIKENKINKSFYDPWGKVTMGIFACALSHKKAWDQALMDGVETALFLEDDVYLTIPVLDNGNFTPEYKSIFNDINEYIVSSLPLLPEGSKMDSSQEGQVSIFNTPPQSCVHFFNVNSKYVVHNGSININSN